MIADCAEISLWFTAVCVSVSLSGVHIVQVMASCEWDDETKEITGFVQVGYDREDFLVFDLKTMTWIASQPQAVIIKHKKDSDKAGSIFIKNVVTNICPQGLKMSLDYGKSSLLRTGRIT